MDSNIFIHRLMMHPHLGKCNVEFRNGLNIIWSQDVVNYNSKEANNIRNSVGKTTFVKFIDYLLGKSYFVVSVDSLKKELFEDKCLLAEVAFGNEQFTVKRSILENEKIFVYEGWVIDQIIAEKVNGNSEKFDLKGYNEFLTEKVYGKNIIVNDKAYITHRSIMSYLIRDQATGFIKYDSGLKEEKSKTRRKRLEFLLGLVSEKREQLENDIDALEEQKAKYANERNILKKYFQLVSETTLSKLKKEKAANEKQIISNEAELARKSDLLGKLKLKLVECKDLETDLNKKTVAIDEEMYVLSLKEKDYNMAFKDIENELHKINNINLAIDMFSPFQYKRCPVYMKELAGDKVSCNHIVENENKNEFKSMTEARKKILSFEKKDVNEALSKVSAFIKDLQKEKAKILKEIVENEKEQNKIEQLIKEQFDKVEEKIKDLRYKNKMIEKELAHFTYVDKLTGYIEDKNADIAEKRESLENIIKSRSFELNEVYNNIVKYLTNNARVGKINIKNYLPAIYHPNGNVDKGSAMGNVAVIAFDLALLELSLKCDEVSKVYPKFLVHDSPKLHDIQIEVYKRIMDYIVKIEKDYEDKNKKFQYILTTLDISEGVEQESDKYIRLTLDNSGDGGKLFGCQVEID